MAKYVKMSEGEIILAAETRAVEEGHRALLTGDKLNGMSVIKVVSDTHPGRWYQVIGHLEPGGLARFECWANDPDFRHGSGKHVPCKHAALAARRLEREGLLRWYDGAWWASEKLMEMLPPIPQPADPFSGLL